MKKGDLIEMTYDAWIADTNELFDTTNEETAKKNKVHDEKTKYKPLFIIVGADRVIKGLDNSLLNASVGNEYKVEIPHTEAYGERDPKLVELFSIQEFRRQQIVPQIGMQVTLKNKVGTIIGVSAGRVRVDFNKPLAGKKLRYEYKVTKNIEDIDQKVDAIISMHYTKGGDFKKQLTEKTVTITTPNTCKYDNEWFLVKYVIANDILEYANIEKVHFVEEYAKKIEEKKETEKKETKETETKEEAKEEKKDETKKEDTKKEGESKETKKQKAPSKKEHKESA
ncbi:MAG: FKBP-type peptidyl-prolyl cis-trans isomerase [Thermoplasmata archaeon]